MMPSSDHVEDHQMEAKPSRLAPFFQCIFVLTGLVLLLLLFLDVFSSTIHQPLSLIHIKHQILEGVLFLTT